MIVVTVTGSEVSEWRESGVEEDVGTLNSWSEEIYLNSQFLVQGVEVAVAVEVEIVVELVVGDVDQ